MTSVIDTLQNGLDEARRRSTDAAAALDEAILTDPELSHKTRMVLINLQSLTRQQNLNIDLMAICVDLLDKRIDNVIKFSR